MSSGAGVVAAIVPSSVVVVREVWASSAVASGSGPSTGTTWGKGQQDVKYCESLLQEPCV
jgi:hypothetical protein